jgi:pimeloyl-ACP methyl ester carboxylesterase
MLHWQRQGSGPEVVLIHGFLGSSKIFEPLTKHLARQFTVTTIDLPGSAGSYDVPVPPSVKDLSLMVAETLRDASIARCSLFGSFIRCMDCA